MLIKLSEKGRKIGLILRIGHKKYENIIKRM